MSHGDYISPIGFWTSSSVPETSDYQRFDIAQAKIINGDAGGSWSPKTPIGIGGAGIAFTTSGTLLIGGTSTSRGGRLVLGANDFVALSPTRTRTITLPLTWMQQMASTSLRGSDARSTLSLAPNPVGIVPAAYGSPLNFVIPPKFLHGGGTLLSAALSFHSSGSGSQGVAFTLSGAAPDGTSSQNITANSAVTWVATTAKTVGNFVKPTSTKQTGFYYKATAAGTTGASEPAWPTTIGGTVADGGVTWLCVGRNGTLNAATIPLINLYSFEAQTITMSQDTAAPLTLDPTQYVYQLSISADGGSILHALTLNFGNITTTAFE